MNLAFSTVFFLSGVASLAYQVAWQRLLTTYYGVNDVSVTLIVSTFLLGLGLGGLVGGRLAERITDRITFYFVVELGIGAFGLASLPLLDLLGRATAGSAPVVALGSMFAFLCVPTFLMGITLPLLTKILAALTGDFLFSVSLLYFANTLGASVGAATASYVLISVFGLDVCVYFAVALNLLLAVVILALRPSVRGAAAPPSGRDFLGGGGSLGRSAFLLVFITGFMAIAYEIAWFRVVRILVKASPYAFSTLLSIYLLGIAFGSLALERFVRWSPHLDRRRLFFTLQFLIGASVMVIFTGFYLATAHTPFSKLTRASFRATLHPPREILELVSTAGVFELFSHLDILAWPLLFFFVPTLFMGASFPLISSLARRGRGDEGRTVGSIYCFNVLGNVLGGSVTGFLVLPALGTEHTLLALSLVGLGFGALVWRPRGGPLRRAAGWAAALLLVAAVVALFPRRGELYLAIHQPPESDWTAVHLEEGTDAVIVSYDRPGGKTRNYINGLRHGSRPALGAHAHALEAASHAPRMDEVLIIGIGGGSTLETLLWMKEVKRITVVEISHSLIRNLRKLDYFPPLVDDPRVELIIDDGRRFLLSTDRRFDVILMDPLRPTTSHSNNLYSLEFFELVREHLAPDGVLMLVFGTAGHVLPRTVSAVFDHLRLYQRLYLLASDTPFTRSEGPRSALLGRLSAEHRASLYNTWLVAVGDETTVARRSGHAPINRDWRPVEEFYLGPKIREALGMDRRRSGLDPD